MLVAPNTKELDAGLSLLSMLMNWFGLSRAPDSISFPVPNTKLRLPPTLFPLPFPTVENLPKTVFFSPFKMVE